jgi:hypothetical protein
MIGKKRGTSEVEGREKKGEAEEEGELKEWRGGNERGGGEGLKRRY